MVIHSIKEIIEAEKRILSTLSVEQSFYKECTLEAIAYHEDIIYYMEKLLKEEEDGAL